MLLEKLVEQIEHQVAAHEAELRRIEAQLADPKGQDVVQLSIGHQQAQVALGASLDSWAAESERLEDLRGMQG